MLIGFNVFCGLVVVLVWLLIRFMLVFGGGVMVLLIMVCVVNDGFVLCMLIW